MKQYITVILFFLFCVNLFAFKDTPVRVMTYNIRMATTADGDNYWDYRKDYAADLVKFYGADIIGMQEVLHVQLLDMQERLTDYSYIGVGREDGAEKGEYCAVFYKKDRFKVLDSGNFWLSEEPELAGKKGWDAACERIATWALFQDKLTKKKFFFLNTHLDHVGKIARREGTSLILKRIGVLAGDKPVIVTGDFNATSNEEPIQVLLTELIDSRTVAGLKYGPEWTFHNYGKIPYEQRSLIDYIFYKGKIKVLINGVLAENKGKLYPSDHAPVLADLLLQ